MSLVYRRILAISLPTLAAVLGILWLRNRRKGRHLPVDPNHSSAETRSSITEKAEEEKFSKSLVLVSPKDTVEKDDCLMSIKDTITSAVESNLITVNASGLGPQNSVLCKKSSELTEEIPVVKESEKGQLNCTIDLLDSEESFHMSGEEIIEKEDSESSSVSFCKIEKTDKLKHSEVEEMKKETEQLQSALNSLNLGKMKDESGRLAEKLASLELDQMKLEERKSASERDSANHSPSEIMLASPSISNFSDAHSEGSSDSGKGQSDIATSPSRTPPGGSSLAGDQAPSVYEFVLPQFIVGRLIGRHGVFLNEIKTETNTNIFIKRHPDSNKLKVCAIEGTQSDIDKALAKIRQKFPLRRFPQLTLEKVSFIQLDPPQPPPLKPEDFHLQLVEGVNNDVVLSSLITAAHFFLQQPCHPSYSSLTTLNTIMRHIYSSGEAPALEMPVNYAVCAAPALEGWYRAQIVHVEEDSQHCTVRFLDYGGYSRLAASNLRQIRGDLLALPFQAVECYLANVAPVDGDEWSEAARLFVQSLTCGQILHAQIFDYAEDGAPLIYLYSSVNNQVVLINEALVLHGYAVIAENGSSCGTTNEDGGRTDEEATKSERETEE